MGEKPVQHELFPEDQAEEVEAPFTESVEGVARYMRGKRQKKAADGQRDMFPEDAEEARRIARWRTPEAQAAQKMWIEIERKILEEQKARKQSRRPDDVIH